MCKTKMSLLGICNDSSRLNNKEKMIRSKLTERKLSIFTAVFGLGFAILLAVVVFLPNIFPNSSWTCLPDRDNNLECGQTEKRVDIFISDVLEKKYTQIVEKEKENREEQFAYMAMVSSSNAINSKMKPAAKLIGKECDLLANNTEKDMAPIDTWCSGVELDKKGGFLRHGVRYYKGRLVVPVPGTYFVYSFVEFYEPCLCIDGTPKAENRKDPIKHALFKYSVIGGKNDEIIGSAQPHTIAKNKYENVYSSHISTVVGLNAGDELSVQVNNVPLLNKYAGDNYFGLVLIE